MSTETTSNTAAMPGKYLTFRLGQEYYSLPVLKVREIMRLCPITAVPRMPAHLRGVINLRGKLWPWWISGRAFNCRPRKTPTARASLSCNSRVAQKT